jgi:flagellar basal-body rod modification protein FlgD
MPTGIQSVGGAITGYGGGTSGILGKDDFLKMLVMQLRFQDPLNPMNGTEFAAQLAQFSSVEQLANINSSLGASLDANYLMTQAITNSLSASLIGKDVKAAAETFRYGGTGDIRLGYNLQSAVDHVTVKILDESGTVVRTITNSGTAKGDNTFTWDGLNDAGETAAAGNYHFTVEAADANGQAITSSRYLYGTVSGVRFKEDGSFFVVDGVEISFANILEILEG